MKCNCACFNFVLACIAKNELKTVNMSGWMSRLHNQTFLSILHQCMTACASEVSRLSLRDVGKKVESLTAELLCGKVAVSVKAFTRAGGMFI